MEHLNSERQINSLKNSARRKVKLQIRRVGLFFNIGWIPSAKWSHNGMETKVDIVLFIRAFLRRRFLNGIALETSSANLFLFILNIQCSFQTYYDIKRIRRLWFQNWRVWLKRGLCGGGQFWSLLYFNEMRFLVLFLIISVYIFISVLHMKRTQWSRMCGDQGCIVRDDVIF